MNKALPRERDLPHAIEAEQAILGGLLLVPESWDQVGELAESDFYRHDHKVIFEAITDLASRERPFDAVTLADWFHQHGHADRVSADYVLDLAANCPGVANIGAYVGLVLEKSRMRRLIDVGNALVQAGFSPEGRSAEDVLEVALRDLDRARTDQQKSSGLRDVPLQAFMETPPGTIGYAVHPVIPRGVVTLWGGHGGSGKSMSALQLMAHGACGAEWQGLTPDGTIRSAYFSLEDPGDLVRYRLRRICESYSLEERRVESNIRVYDCPDGRPALMTEVSSFGIRQMTETALLAQVRRLCSGADLVVIDNASDAFGGNENDRQSVRAFMTALGRIARECNAGVVLLAHIDKSAARNGANGNTYSGSTAWHNSARSRLAIVAGAEAGEVQLHHEKNNLGKLADAITLKWNNHGVLVPLSPIERRERVVDTGALVMSVLAAAARRGISVPTATTGQSPGHKAVQHIPEYSDAFGKDRFVGSRKFHAALDELHEAGRIVKHVARSGYRKQIEVWAIAEVGAPNDAPNTAPNAPNTDCRPPYKNPEGVLYRGATPDSARGSAHSAQDSAQGAGFQEERQP